MPQENIVTAFKTVIQLESKLTEQDFIEAFGETMGLHLWTRLTRQGLLSLWKSLDSENEDIFLVMADKVLLKHA